MPLARQDQVDKMLEEENAAAPPLGEASEIVAYEVNPANLPLPRTPVKQGAFQRIESTPYFEDSHMETQKPTPRGMDTPQARYREAAAEMADFEYDEEYYDENPGVRSSTSCRWTSTADLV